MVFSILKHGLLRLMAFLLIAAPAAAQYPVFSQVGGKDQFRDGNVTRLIQDKQGLMWIGTTRGLFVYDGFDFHAMNLVDSTAQQVTALTLGPDGNVWVGFSDGRIARGNERGFSLFSPAEGKSAASITSILFEPDTTLWFATYGEGIYFFRNNRLYNINTDDGLGDNDVYTLARFSDGTIWAGNDAGISVCTKDPENKVLRHYSMDNGLPDIIVQKLEPSSTGGMWIGMQEKGICYFDPVNKTFETAGSDEWHYGPVNDLLDFGDVLWIATDGSGLIEFSINGSTLPDGFRFIRSPGNRISRLLHDREGSVWLVSSGELKWSPGPAIRIFRKAGDLTLGNIHVVHAEDDDSFWFGNDKGLFYFIPGEKNGVLKQLLTAQSKGGPGITSIYHDPEENIWVGTFGNGLYRIPEGLNAFKKITDPSGRLNDNILGISGVGDDIWFATLGGVARCSYKPTASGGFRFDHFTSAEGLGNNFVYTAFADRIGRIWFGTDGMGPVVYENKKFRSFGAGDGMPSKVIYSVAEDRDGNLWFSSAKDGVYKFDGRTFTNFNLKSGLRDLRISALEYASENQIVVVNEKGIDLINSRTGQITYPGLNCGIDEINPDLNAVAADSKGSVWIGTHDGLIHYTPEYSNLMAMPVTSVRKVTAYLSDDPVAEGAELPFDHNHISIEYIGLWFNNPEKVNYRVRLDGNDPDWIYTGDRVTTYSNLRPGKYTFRVQSSLNGNFELAAESYFTFTINAPFYKRWWFILPLGLMMAALGYLFFRMRLNRIKREQQLLKEKAESRFQMLKSQVNPHFLFNNFSTLMAIIEEDKDLAIEYVGKLSAFFRFILEYRDKDLIPVSEELAIVENYLFLQKKRYGDNLVVKTDIHPEHLISLIPPLTLQLLLENAVKHNIVSASKPLYICICSENEMLVVENRLQPRKTPEISTGMGLENIRSRYRIFTHTEIILEQTSSLFRVSLPLIPPKSDLT